MSYKSLMVHLDPSAGAVKRLTLAVDLAKRLEARLIGVTAARPTDPLPLRPGAAGDSQRLGRDVLDQRIEALRADFEAAARGLKRQWRSALAPPAGFFADQARAADLLIVGRCDRDGDPQFGYPLEHLMMTAGRPLLVAPPNTAVLTADRVVVAWKPGRPARLAVELALPLLVAAAEVTVVGVGDGCHQQEVDDVADYLTLHGARAHGRWRPLIGATETETLIEAAVMGSADLIVCGAQCRNALQQWVMGGMTARLLAESPVCLLMAH